MASPSIRSLAHQLGLSAATVSLALRDSPHVIAATKDRVLRAARQAGYRPNALVSSVMTGVRRSVHGSFQGTLMAINHSADANPTLLPYHREVLEGAQRRAEVLGYTLTHCWLGPHGLSLKRLNSILVARGVQGVIVMPFSEAQDFSALNWDGLAAAMMDYCLTAPALTTILPDHHLSLLRALEHLRGLGYRRPGLVVEHARDERLHHRWSAAYGSFSWRLEPEEIVPVLLQRRISRTLFLNWFQQHRPDVIVGHIQDEAKAWLEELGLRIPQDAGFLHLNWTERTGPCASLDLQPAVLGAAALEAVVAQLQRNERGIPENPKAILITARWVDGATLRVIRGSSPAAGSSTMVSVAS